MLVLSMAFDSVGHDVDTAGIHETIHTRPAKYAPRKSRDVMQFIRDHYRASYKQRKATITVLFAALE